MHRAVRRISLGTTASASLLGAARLAAAGTTGKRAPHALGALGGTLAVRLLIDIMRDRDHTRH